MYPQFHKDIHSVIKIRFARFTHVDNFFCYDDFLNHFGLGRAGKPKKIDFPNRKDR